VPAWICCSACAKYVFSVIFTARRYAGAVLAMALCLSVRPVCIEATGRIGLVWHGVFLPTLCYKEIRSSPQSKRTSSGALLQTLALENFATASRSCCQQLVDGRACWWHDGLRVVAAHTLFNTRPLLQLHYFDFLWICCTTCSYSQAAVDMISTDTAHRAVRLR